MESLLAEPEVKRWWVDSDYERDHGWVVEVDGSFGGWVQYEEETYEWYPSVALDISPDRKTLYVHVMYMDTPDAAREQIKRGFERRVLGVLG